MKLGVKIKGMKEREPFIDYELERLGLKNKKNEVVMYCDKTRDIKNLCVEAMKSLGSDITHALILDDDVLLCDDCLSLVKKCCKNFPDAVFGFCTRHHFPFKEKDINEKESPYLKFESRIFFFGQAFLFPMKYLDDYAQFCKKNIPNVPNSDRALIKFCKSRNIPVMTVYPSLVQHRYTADSLLDHDTSRLQSLYWFGEEAPTHMNFDIKEYTEV